MNALLITIGIITIFVACVGVAMLWCLAENSNTDNSTGD